MLVNITWSADLLLTGGDTGSHGGMGSWSHGGRSHGGMEPWGHGVMEAWRQESSRNGDMEAGVMETGGMASWRQ